MPDILNTSLTGMLAFQRAIDVTGHNIANANTPGYTRQVADFRARIGQGADDVYVGGGVKIGSVRRIYDALLGEQLQSATTGEQRFRALNELASRIDGLLADPTTGLNTGLQSFFNGVQDLANDPASIPGRQALIGEAEGLAARFRNLDQQLDELDREVNARIRLAIDDVNRLANAIADVNDKIALAGADSRPNDLLDERDRLVLELSGLIGVSTTVQEDGAMNVFIGTGQPLVTGTRVAELGVIGSEFDPTRAEVVYQGDAGNTPLSNSLTGGTLGGLMEFRGRILDPSRQSLGQTATAFAQQFNEQHSSGMDLRGSLGGDFFSLGTPTVLASGNNTGAGTAAATVTDLGNLTGADYILEYDGAAYSLTRADTGAAVALAGTGAAADPFIADGMSIVVGGAPAAGDRLMIRSTNDAAGSIRNLITDPQAVAVAAPTRSAASLANIGNASISAASVVDAADPNLLVSATIEFVDPNTYTINGAGAFAYTDGDPIVINGTSVTISGAPSAGDQFTIEANFGASGDNGNALELADIQAVGLLDGGSISVNENYARLVSSVGSTTRQVQASLDAQSVLRLNAEDSLQSVSGVNLDEEAAKLIRYQQSYQAMAQMIGVVSTLFDTLIGATRR